MKRKVILIISVALLLAGKVSAQEPKPLTKQQKERLINNLLKSLNDTYIFPDVAQKATLKIREYHKNGKYAAISVPREFTKMLTADLRELMKDKHLGVGYRPAPAVGRVIDTLAEKAQQEKFMRHMSRMNLGFPKAEILEGNIGLLKVDGFGPVDKVGETCSAAINFLANTDALIIDLRDNHGGEPEMVQYLASYFFGDAPVHINDLYFRNGNRTEEYWTIPVKGAKYLNKPVYVLISGHTFSGGEELAYDLQTQKRATLVGETTGGGANPGDEVPLGDGYMAFIPNGRAVNPVTNTNWEGVGVQPDIAMPASDTLKEAHILALKAVMEKLPEDEKGFYSGALEKVNGK